VIAKKLAQIVPRQMLSVSTVPRHPRGVARGSAMGAEAHPKNAKSQFEETAERPLWEAIHGNTHPQPGTYQMVPN
jgi:hypothetical protein